MSHLANTPPGHQYDELDVRQIAFMCHEANRAYCKSIGDDSQKPWKEAPKWQRDSAIAGVKFHLESAKTPEESHQEWMKVKAEAGWVYGDVKNESLKTHPCMKAYAELPEAQKIKDVLFKSIVEACKTIIDADSSEFIDEPEEKKA